MQLDDQLLRYFGTADLATIPAGVLPDAIDRMRVDLGMERDKGRRFALWALLYLLGASPDLDIAFPDPADRDAARDFMDMAASAEDSAQ